MKNDINNLKDLFIEQGREIYNAVIQEEKELKQIKEHANDKELRAAIEKEETAVTEQKKWLQDAFDRMSIEPKGESNICTEAILKQAKDYIERSKDPEIRDAAIINAIQRMNHNKITSLGSFKSYAKEIGENTVVDSIKDSLTDEKQIDKTLSELAIRSINKRAAVTVAY